MIFYLPHAVLTRITKLSKNLRLEFSGTSTACKFDDRQSSVPEHRGQMMIFCGHEKWCHDFNSKHVYEMAKLNVNKYFPVVGGILLNE